MHVARRNKNHFVEIVLIYDGMEVPAKLAWFLRIRTFRKILVCNCSLPCVLFLSCTHCHVRTCLAFVRAGSHRIVIHDCCVHSMTQEFSVSPRTPGNHKGNNLVLLGGKSTPYSCDSPRKLWLIAHVIMCWRSMWRMSVSEWASTYAYVHVFMHWRVIHKRIHMWNLLTYHIRTHLTYETLRTQKHGEFLMRPCTYTWLRPDLQKRKNTVTHRQFIARGLGAYVYVCGHYSTSIYQMVHRTVDQIYAVCSCCWCTWYSCEKLVTDTQAFRASNQARLIIPKKRLVPMFMTYLFTCCCFA